MTVNKSPEWVGMPEFKMEKQRPYHLLEVIHDVGVLRIRFADADALEDFSRLYGQEITIDIKQITVDSYESFGTMLGQKITNKTKSIWHPYKSHWGGVKYRYISDRPLTNRYPVYVVSKGRYDNGLTTKALHVMGIAHYIVVEQSEYQQYIENKNSSSTVLILPQKYLDDYDTCDLMGNTKSKGPGAARNFCFDHSIDANHAKHWVMDDNLDAFHYLTNNEKYEVECASTICATEDFVDRYSNVPIAGFNYYSFCKKTDAVPAYVLNTRIYSCLLMDNSSSYRWRGRYNEDTDICLRVLKDGLCTIQLNAFLCGKVTTQRMSGGNSKEFYDNEGTLPKSKMLENLHPDVASVVWRFNRWHHHVDYSKFKNNKLILKYPLTVTGNNSYGLIKVAR